MHIPWCKVLVQLLKYNYLWIPNWKQKISRKITKERNKEERNNKEGRKACCTTQACFVKIIQAFKNVSASDYKESGVDWV